MSSPIRRIAVCTGGGDAPGLNAVIRSVVIAASNRGWECYGIREGFNGIMFPERYPEGGVFRLTRERVRGIGHLGGTILGTTNKGNPLQFPMKMPDGSIKEIDRTDEILEYFAKKELDALVSIGGDGSLTIANALHQKGLRVVSVPKTID
ncbi:MAG: 6-phosphofructokinase, partial [Holophaga sp.]|nr:6-phosphofructokinase [Holophaga sp.]